MKYLLTSLLILLPAVSLEGQADSAALTERGRYLVHSVAMCVQCHSPRTAEGKLIPGKLLEGEAVPVSSPFQNLRFASRAPHIAGLPGYSKEQAMRLLTEGIAANGTAPQAPMPPFRLSKEDAEAVVTYLKSLR